MHGFPKVLKTRKDFERCHGRTPHEAIDNAKQIGAWHGLLSGRYKHMFTKNRMLAAWQALLAGRFKYVFDRELAADEKPDGSEPDYRVVEDEELGRRQYKLVEDKSAKIYKLGFSADEVENQKSELEAK